MVNIFEKYNGRKIKDTYFEMVQDEFEELDDTFLYRFQFSAQMEALLYLSKENFTIQGTRVLKTTPSGKWNLLTEISPSAAKTLDQKLNLLLEEANK